jgi:hypothetical protein
MSLGETSLGEATSIQNFDHNIRFWEKRQFFRRKLSKIAKIVIITSTAVLKPILRSEPASRRS